MTPERYRILEDFILLSPESYLPKTDWEPGKASTQIGKAGTRPAPSRSPRRPATPVENVAVQPA